MYFDFMKGSLKEKQRELSVFVSNFLVEEYHKYKFAAVNDQIYSYYSGEYKIAEINEIEDFDYYSGEKRYRRYYDLHTSSVTRSESTPDFNFLIFHEKTEYSSMTWRLTIYVPDNLVEESRLVIDVDYDIGWWDQISISHFGGENFISFNHQD